MQYEILMNQNFNFCNVKNCTILYDATDNNQNYFISQIQMEQEAVN